MLSAILVQSNAPLEVAELEMPDSKESNELISIFVTMSKRTKANKMANKPH